MTVTDREDQINEFHIPTELSHREFPVIHPTSDAPLCSDCQQLDLPFFDLDCPECLEILHNTETTISQIFAIIRQWIPQTQQNIEALVTEILKRGAHIDDRDGLTDMTLLHYACKAGAVGIGNVISATGTVQMLLKRGCDIHLRCRWTDMAALHYAVYFDVVPVLELLLEADNRLDVNNPCQEFDGGSSLHIAAANLCVETTMFLLKHKANVVMKDQLGRTPYDCIPEFPNKENMPDVNNIISRLRTLLRSKNQCDCDSTDFITVTGKTVLKSLRLNLGDKIIIGGAKVGSLRYCGTTKFATGIWAGVELEEPLGKNDGTVDGVTYFKCLPYYGIFAPISKICKFSELAKNNGGITSSQRSLLPRHISYKKIDISHVTSKIETGLTTLKPQIVPSEAKELVIGDRVCIGCRNGIIKYIGETKFAQGLWYGIELDKAEGKNSGSVQGIKYFNCKPNHGLFVPVSKLSKLQKYSDDASSQSSLDKNSGIGRNSMDSETERTQSDSLNPSRPSKKTRCSIPTANASNNAKNMKGCWLTVGINVFVNNEIATVKYLGKVAFAEGVWIGVELRKPKGRNDGSVQGYRYFTCKPCHGLMVRPNRITVRGINGSKLIGAEN